MREGKEEREGEESVREARPPEPEPEPEPEADELESELRKAGRLKEELGVEVLGRKRLKVGDEVRRSL